MRVFTQTQQSRAVVWWVYEALEWAICPMERGRLRPGAAARLRVTVSFSLYRMTRHGDHVDREWHEASTDANLPQSFLWRK